MHTTSASHLNLSQYDTEAIKKAVEQKKWEKTVNTEIPKHINSDQYMGQEDLTPQQDSSIFVKPEKLFNVKPGPLEISPQNSFGLPLLHLQLKPPNVFSSVSRASVTVPSIPISTVAEERKYPKLLLLHSYLSQENMVMFFTGCKSTVLCFSYYKYYTFNDKLLYISFVKAILLLLNI